jgi:beta-glucosidase
VQRKTELSAPEFWYRMPVLGKVERTGGLAGIGRALAFCLLGPVLLSACRGEALCVPGTPHSAQAKLPPASVIGPTAPVRHYAFQDADLPDERRLDDLLSQLTVAEKVKCLGTLPNVPRLGIRGSDHVEGLHGLALGGPGNWGGPNPLPTTTFPQAIGLAQTWDPELLQKVAALEGREARYAFHVKGRGGLVIRAPNADLGRDPRWGRTEECYGEDPFLTGRLATAFVRGLQGDHPRYWQTAALLKHFLANENENERDKTSSDFDQRLFHEYYSVGFREAMQVGGARAFMAAYNLHNGVPCTIHPMLREVTLRQWDTQSLICTDAGALGNLVRSQKVSPDLPSAAAASVRAGISQFLDNYEGAVQEALARGLLKEAELDEAVRRNFRVMLRLGLLDPNERVPYAQVEARDADWESAQNASLVREVTRASIVLLKNQGGLLPLVPARLKSVALIGRRADEVLLDWYSGTPPYTVTPREAIQRRLGEQVRVDFAKDDSEGRAVALARRADVAIVCVGNHPTGDAGWAQVAKPSYGKEAVDRESITLEDEALVQAVRAANPRTVLVLMASFPYAINWSQQHVPAILQMTHNSQEQGNALSDVLFGDSDAGGRLVQTWPRSLDDLPPMLDYDLRHGRTYLYSSKKPLYPFGFGLSYTRFQYSALRSSARSLSKTGSVSLSLNVKNVGTRAGDEVVQLYVRRPTSKIARPLQELKGFSRVAIDPGAQRSVEFSLDAKALAHWDSEQQRFEVEPGPVEVRIGRSSADIRLSTTVAVSE